MSSFFKGADPAIQYMYYRDVEQNTQKMKSCQDEAINRGFIRNLLDRRNPNGHWGLHYYQPKWTSTHYTLLDFVDFGLKADHEVAQATIRKMISECIDEYGTLNFSKTKLPSDNAINGMALNYLIYFNAPIEVVEGIVNFLMQNQHEDGGFSWAHHREELESDRNSSICIGEGLLKYYSITKSKEVEDALKKLTSYFQKNHYWLEDKSVKKISYPYRYYYSMLRVMEFLVGFNQEIPDELIGWLKGKKDVNGFWHLENNYSGAIHFPYEPLHQKSKIITIKAIRILNQGDHNEKTF